MVSLLKKIHNPSLIQYLFLGFIGAISVFAFSPFDIKFVIVISLVILIQFIITSRNFHEALKVAFAWGFGYWVSGTGWLIVSIYYYGNTGIILSIFLVILMGILLSFVFIGPLSILKLIESNQNIFFKSMIFASMLLILELSRFLFLGGFPWLLPGLVFVDTLGANVIPIFGVYGASFITYFLSSFIALCIVRKKKNHFILGILSLLILLPFQTNQKESSNESLSIAIIQPSLDPFKKFQHEGYLNIEDALIELTNENLNEDLIIWPESPLPYLNFSLKMENLLTRLDGAPPIISGAWEYENNKLHNTMTVLGSNQSYSKRHLVPFGEYVPFEGILRGLINFFDLPMSSVSKGKPNQGLFEINNFKVLGIICFDAAFPLSYLDEIREANFIVNISNDTWFGSSYGPHQHLQIVRARALESNKWIARGTSDGISTIVDNKGTIVNSLSKGLKGSLKGQVYKTAEPSLFYRYGYIITPLICFIFLAHLVILRFRK